MILEMPTSSQRWEALEILPTDLYDSFQGIITRIRQRPNASAMLGMQVLMWLHFARRPLKLAELRHALAIKRGHMEFNWGNIPSQKTLLDCCLGLVLVDEETLTVRFVHFTLEEYFRDNSRTEFPEGCSFIAESCLTYLNCSQLRPHCTGLDNLKETITKYPFLNYAAFYWGTYVKQQCSDGVTRLVRMLLEHESERPPCALQALFLQITESYDYQGKISTSKFSGAHTAAYFGLSEIVANFCEVEIKDEINRTPLSWAAEYGHEAVVRLLLERDGVDINSRDNLYEHNKTPLIWAAENGHEAVVRLLLERDGVDINAKDSYHEKTPLIWAAENGHEAVVRLLLERDGVDINAIDTTYNKKTSLIWAAENGHEAVVRLLLERDGIDINAKDDEGKTSLTWAIEKGHEAVVRLLLERGGVDIDARDNSGKTPLMYAAKGGHEAVVRLLIERGGVDIDARDNLGKTPLMYAAKGGHEAVVRLLIERDGVDIDAKDNKGKTPLMYAAKDGHEAVVRLLLKRDGIDINARDNQGLTPLIWAARDGRVAVVQLLLGRGGIDINAKDDEGKTSLTWAIEKGHGIIVQLLDNRRDMLARDPGIAPGSPAGDVMGVEAEGVSGATAT